MIGARSNATAEYVYMDVVGKGENGDPALDWESKEFSPKDYFRTFDRKYLPLKSGKTATVFKFRRLPRTIYTALNDLPGAGERSVQTICYGLTGLDNFLNANGTPVVLEFVGEGNEKRLTKDTLDAIFSASVFAELATVISKYSDLDPLVDERSGRSQS